MRIGNYQISYPLFLAPMDDITDHPFRLICKEWGADVLISEFISAEAIVRYVPQSFRKMSFDKEERPIGIQIYGSSIDSMTKSAQIVQEHAPDFIDINAGCWVKKIVSKGEGAGLLKDLIKLEKIIVSIRNSVSIPVSIKTRLGWDSNNITIFNVVKIAQENGIDFITVHLRTREDGLKGKADWSWISKIKEECKIPLIVNGDIKTPEDAKECFRLGADGVMIGRGAIGNPLIFHRCKKYVEEGVTIPPPDLIERVKWCLKHFELHIQYYGEEKGIVLFRKFYNWYFCGYPYISKIRKLLISRRYANEVKEILYLIIESPEKIQEIPHESVETPQ
ncbi:MAG: tRNA dihydrouridine synthase DusB [Candidatus Hydrogenedentes bacterium]|nr:tRNA dihydrouridine synthase DusB [Candidatus Hydrogenedentota bacterium]